MVMAPQPPFPLRNAHGSLQKTGARPLHRPSAQQGQVLALLLETVLRLEVGLALGTPQLREGGSVGRAVTEVLNTFRISALETKRAGSSVPAPLEMPTERSWKVSEAAVVGSCLSIPQKEY